MSESVLAVQQNEEGYEVKVKMAGVSADNFGLDVVNDRLWVYHFVDLFAERPEGLENLKTAHTIGNLFLPNDVNAEEIVARFDAQANVLKISIPFNQAKRNFRRHIDIEKW
jgi:HSP20 family molecular chaperone IbpA